MINLQTENMKYTFFYKGTIFFAWVSIFLKKCWNLGWDFLKIFLNFYLFIFFNVLIN